MCAPRLAAVGHDTLARARRLRLGPESAPGASRGLAQVLRQIYAAPGEPGERWRHRGPEVVLPDGTRVPRDKAVSRRAWLRHRRTGAAGREGDDPVLGAWLLGTVAEAERASAAPVLRPPSGIRTSG